MLSDAKKSNDDTLNMSALIRGFLIGLVIGGVAALFRAPRSGNEMRQLLAESEQNLREKIETAVIPVDPVMESMAEGKAAARRRRAELGLDRPQCEKIIVAADGVTVEGDDRAFHCNRDGPIDLTDAAATRAAGRVVNDRGILHRQRAGEIS